MIASRYLLRSLASVLMAGGVAHADHEGAAEFLGEKDAIWSYRGVEAQGWKLTELPDGLWDSAKAYFGGENVPDRLYFGFAFDLNGDAEKEYFLVTPLGGSAGRYYTIQARVKGTWREIGAFQGGFHLLKPKDGERWCQLVIFSRGGGGHYVKGRMDYVDGLYERRWLWRWHNGRVTQWEGEVEGGVVKDFVREPDAVWSSSAGKEESFQREGLSEVMKPFLEEAGVHRDTFTGYLIDLNGDGEEEYFIRTPLGGTGGPHYAIASRSPKGSWRVIGVFQGRFHLLPPQGKSEWKRIVAIARGGSGVYGKYRFEYSDGSYRKRWEALLERGQIVREGQVSE